MTDHDHDFSGGIEDYFPADPESGILTATEVRKCLVCGYEISATPEDWGSDED